MVEYNLQTKRAKQTLGTFSFYDLEGSFEQAIEQLKSIYAYYITTFKDKKAIVRHSDIWHGYADKVKSKEVSFDKFEIELKDDPYESGRQMYVVKGERDILPEELAALESNNKAEEDKRRQRDEEEFARLAKRLGKKVE